MHQKDTALPWRRLREVDAMLKVFESTTALSAKNVRDAWQKLPQYVQQHESTAELWLWLHALGEEGHESENIVRSMPEWKTDIHALNIESRQKSAHGICVGTMHGAKGLEFHTVIVFSGQTCEPENHQEELRLRYVAMTRSQQNLILMQADLGGSWFTSLPIEAKRLSEEICEPMGEKDLYQCGMEDVDLDYLAHQALEVDTHDMHEGMELEYDLDSGGTGILSYQGRAVAKLSRSMLQKLTQRKADGWHIASCKVDAILRRYKSDSKTGFYRNRCKHEAWDVIVPEIGFQKNMYG